MHNKSILITKISTTFTSSLCVDLEASTNKSMNLCNFCIWYSDETYFRALKCLVSFLFKKNKKINFIYVQRLKWPFYAFSTLQASCGLTTTLITENISTTTLFSLFPQSKLAWKVRLGYYDSLNIRRGDVHLKDFQLERKLGPWYITRDITRITKVALCLDVW